MRRGPLSAKLLKMKIVKKRAAMYMFVTNGRFCVAKNVKKCQTELQRSRVNDEIKLFSE
jgi:hypothetical protein